MLLFRSFLSCFFCLKFLNLSLPLESKLLVNWIFFFFPLWPRKENMQVCDRGGTHTNTQMHTGPISILLFDSANYHRCALCTCRHYHYSGGVDEGWCEGERWQVREPEPLSAFTNYAVNISNIYHLECLKCYLSVCCTCKPGGAILRECAASDRDPRTNDGQEKNYCFS